MASKEPPVGQSNNIQIVDLNETQCLIKEGDVTSFQFTNSMKEQIKVVKKQKLIIEGDRPISTEQIYLDLPSPLKFKKSGILIGGDQRIEDILRIDSVV